MSLTTALQATARFIDRIQGGQKLLLAAESKLDFSKSVLDGKAATMNVLVGTEEQDGVKAIVVAWRGSDGSDDFLHANLRVLPTDVVQVVAYFT